MIGSKAEIKKKRKRELERDGLGFEGGDNDRGADKGGAHNNNCYVAC